MVTVLASAMHIVRVAWTLGIMWTWVVCGACASAPPNQEVLQSAELDVYEKGSGEVVVFLPGLGATLMQFKQDVDALSSDVRGIALSLRGHGRSFRPVIAGDENAYTPARMAEDVVAALDERGVGTFHLVGNSLGGLVAYELLQLHPGRVKSLLTFGTTAELHRGGLTLAAVTTMAAVLGPGGLAALAESTASEQPHVGARVRKMMAQTDQDALTLGARAIADYSYLAALHKQAVPYLLLRGDQDADINDVLASTVRIMTSMPCARVKDVPQAGHFLNMDAPRVFRRALLDHVQAASGPCRLGAVGGDSAP